MYVIGYLIQRPASNGSLRLYLRLRNLETILRKDIRSTRKDRTRVILDSFSFLCIAMLRQSMRLPEAYTS